MRAATALLALLSLSGVSACASQGGAWRAPASTAARVSGGVLAAAGPAVMIAGIMLDPEPSTPPVETFVVGGALAAVGVAAVIAGGVLAEDAPAG